MSASPRRLQREAAAARVLNTADVVLCTLAFAGSAALRRITAPFAAVVIDEAAQALEPACLVPHGGAARGAAGGAGGVGRGVQTYLVGDPVQLPATVISQRAAAKGYQQSLFKRLQAAGHPVTVLKARRGACAILPCCFRGPWLAALTRRQAMHESLGRLPLQHVAQLQPI